MLAACLLVAVIQSPSLTTSSPELRLSYDEFRRLYDQGEVLVLDTRGQPAYRAGHIAGAQWLPLDAVEARIPELKKEKRVIVTYCS
jgi:rhodanese-related sulfurtransferase